MPAATVGRAAAATPKRVHQSSDWKGLTYYDRGVWLPAGAPLKPGGVYQEVEAGSTLFVHYSAFAGMGVDTLQEQIGVMRAIYHDHTTNPEKLWSDIAYNWIVFQPYGDLRLARVFRGRGSFRVPASQQGCNAGNLSVCVITLDERIKPETVSRIKSIYRRVECTKVAGHRDCPGSSTRCPGPKLAAVLPEIRAAK